jgi:DNA-directed RNA polymerase omega subunit
VQTYGKVDSKFRFVILASKRAKQLLRGAKAKVRTKTKNPIRIAQIEVKEGLIDYEILQPGPEVLPETEEQVFSAGDVSVEDVDDGAVAGEDEVVEDEEAESPAEDGYEEELPGSDSGGEKDDA